MIVFKGVLTDQKVSLSEIHKYTNTARKGEKKEYLIKYSLNKCFLPPQAIVAWVCKEQHRVALRTKLRLYRIWQGMTSFRLLETNKNNVDYSSVAVRAIESCYSNFESIQSAGYAIS